MSEKAEVLLRPNGGAAAEKRVTVFMKAKGGMKAVGGAFLLLNPKTVSKARGSPARAPPRIPSPPPLAYLPKRPPVRLFAASVTQRPEVDQRVQVMGR